MKRFLFFLFLSVISFVLVEADSTSSSASEWVNTLSKRIKLSGYAQGGYEYYNQCSPKGQYKISRIILMADAQVTDRIRTYVMYDAYASQLHELWVNYKFNDAINVRFGEFKTPFSIENSMSPTVTEMIYPLSLATSYMIGGADVLMMKGSAGRDYGLNVNGVLLNGFLTYDLSLMSGTGRNKMDLNSQKDVVVRLGFHPIEGLTLSGSALTGRGNIDVFKNPDGSDTYVSDVAPISGLRHNGNFRRDRYAAGFEWLSAPVNLRSEFMAGRDGNTHSKGVYATGSVNNVGIKHLDLIGSYDYLNVWSGQKRRYTGGFQYWFYPRCRFTLTYGRLINDNIPNENCILTQIQIRF